jgi:hypothetical protein
MLHRSLLLAAVLAALAGLAGAGCKGATGGQVPVDHPIYEHQPPEVADGDDLDDLDDETDEAD